MAIYQYKAKTAEGKTVKGSIEAPDENGFYARLKEQNYYVISWSEAEKKQKTPKLKPKQLAEFCRSLARCWRPASLWCGPSALFPRKRR